MTTVEEPIPSPDAEEDDALDPKTVPSELVANSVGEYLKASFSRMRGGETGVLPVVAGLLLVSILFQARTALVHRDPRRASVLARGHAPDPRRRWLGPDPEQRHQQHLERKPVAGRGMDRESAPSAS
jgi:hypothetical protein